MSPGRARIDGCEVALEGPITVLDGARRLGIQIPTLCSPAGLPAPGGCRLCLVEVSGDVHLHAACHTLLRDGMDVRTQSPRIDALRRAVLELILSEGVAADPPGRD